MSPSLVDRTRPFWRLDRQLVGPETDVALRLVQQAMPPEAHVALEYYVPTTPVWTWWVPGRWACRTGTVTVQGRCVADYAISPLHVWAGSTPYDGWLSWEAFQSHLRIGPAALPDAVPWVTAYYEPVWGFSVSHAVGATLPTDARYRVVLDTVRHTGVDDGLGVAVGYLPGTRSYDVLWVANVCHPHQVNDSITGVVAAIEVAQRLVARPLPPRSRGVRFLFCPETIGSICYLAHHPELRIEYGVCAEMLGTSGPLILHRDRYDGPLTRMAQRALARARAWDTLPFGDPRAARNDELVLEMAGQAGVTPDVTAVGLTRFPYPEYHTSADTPACLDDAPFAEAVDVLECLVRIAASDYRPRRTFQGPLFLSGHGLWVPWESQPALNARLDGIMARLNGYHSVFQIAEDLDASYLEVRAWIDGLVDRGFVEILD